MLVVILCIIVIVLSIIVLYQGMVLFYCGLVKCIIEFQILNRRMTSMEDQFFSVKSIHMMKWINFSRMQISESF